MRTARNKSPLRSLLPAVTVLLAGILCGASSHAFGQGTWSSFSNKDPTRTTEANRHAAGEAEKQTPWNWYDNNYLLKERERDREPQPRPQAKPERGAEAPAPSYAAPPERDTRPWGELPTRPRHNDSAYERPYERGYLPPERYAPSGERPPRYGYPEEARAPLYEVNPWRSEAYSYDYESPSYYRRGRPDPYSYDPYYSGEGGGYERPYERPYERLYERPYERPYRSERGAHGGYVDDPYYGGYDYPPNEGRRYGW